MSNVPLLDTLPLAFYILPLMVILPKILLDLYRTRSAFLSILILAISAFIFGLISSLVRGFFVLVLVNIVSCVLIFIMGGFRPSQPIRSIGKKGVAWFLLMNVLGFMMPISVVVMGQTPIATVESNHDVALFVEVPLADFGAGFQDTPPDVDLIESLSAASFGVDLRYPSNDSSKLDELSDWIQMLNSYDIPFRITISSDRNAILSMLDELNDSHISVLDIMVSEFWSVLLDLSNITDTQSINASSLPVFFDMMVSENEWQSMMTPVRNVNLVGFSEYIRNQLDSIKETGLLGNFISLISDAESFGFDYGFLVDGFVIDDLVDGDSTIAQLDCIPTGIIQEYQLKLEVSCSRTQYSDAMQGDVGEYLSYTYSRSAMASAIRLGIAGNNTGILPIENPVYDNLEVLANDIAISSGNGASQIVISSLPSILASFGEDGLSLLRDAFQNIEKAEVTYTFRIYAFRAVMMAIDSFDSIML